MLENAALRHQLAVLKRSVSRPKIQDSDRMFWIPLKRMLADWRDAVHFVKPDTIVRWHSKGFRYYWRRKSRGEPGRPPIGRDLIYLIRQMSNESSPHQSLDRNAPEPRKFEVVGDVCAKPVLGGLHHRYFRAA